MGNLITACRNYRKCPARKPHLFEPDPNISFDTSHRLRQAAAGKTGGNAFKTTASTTGFAAFRTIHPPHPRNTWFALNRQSGA